MSKLNLLFVSMLMITFSFVLFAEEAQITEAIPAAKAPSVFVTYGYYKYNLEGKNAANNGIYKFGTATTDLHMLTTTWLYSPNWTFLVFVPYIKNRVETIYLPNVSPFKTTDYTEGLSDIRFMAMTPLAVEGAHLLMGDVSVTAPTGSVDQYFTAAPAQRASYNMQPGSGTPDLLAGLGYTFTQPQWVSTARGQFTLRGGKNAKGWALGNELLITAASKYALSKYFELGVAGNYKAREAVVGRDEKYELNNNFNGGSVVGDGHQYYHAAQINWDTEFVAKVSSPAFANLNVVAEAGLPFWQGFINKDDIRLEMPYWFSLSLNSSF